MHTLRLRTVIELLEVYRQPGIIQPAGSHITISNRNLYSSELKLLRSNEEESVALLELMQ